MNKKVILLIMGIVVLLSIFVVTQTDLLEPAAIVSISEVTEEDGITYYYVNAVEYTFTAQDVRTYTLPETDVEGTDSQGRDVEGTLKANFKIVQGDFIGWQTPMASRNAGEWVSSVWAEDAFIGRNIKWATSPNFIYYQPSSGAMILNDYVVTVIIDGETYELPIQSHNNKGLRKVPNTNPPIYWEETFFALSSESSLPSISMAHDVIEMDDKSIMLAQQGSVPKILTIWNALYKDDLNLLLSLKNSNNLPGVPTYESMDWYINKRIDFEPDGEYDIQVDDGKKFFTKSDVINNNYQYRTYHNVLGQKSPWYQFPDFNTNVFKSSVSSVILEDMYMIHNSDDIPGTPDAIAEPNKLVMAGRWKIPIDYGDIRVKTYLPVPEIVSTEWTSTAPVKPGGIVDLKVVVKNNGDDPGKITVYIRSTDYTSLLQLPPSQEITLDPGESGTLTFTFVGQESIINPTTSHLRVYAQGGETEVTKDITKAVEPFADNGDGDTYHVKITAVNKDYVPLGNMFPVIIGQTGEKSYGFWEGNLEAGTVYIKGEEVTVAGKTYYPQNRNIIVSGDSEFYLVYVTDKPSPGSGSDSDIDYTIYAIILILLILMAGLYMYFDKQEKKGKR